MKCKEEINLFINKSFKTNAMKNLSINTTIFSPSADGGDAAGRGGSFINKQTKNIITNILNSHT